MRYWISWYQPTEDYRPLTDPPVEGVLGWWCSGEGADGSATLCALVEAGSENAARTVVHGSWPEAKTWRFCEERELDWTPGNRFPLSDWMTARIGHWVKVSE